MTDDTYDGPPQFAELEAAKIIEWQVRELLEATGRYPAFWERRLSAWEAQYTAQPKE